MYDEDQYDVDCEFGVKYDDIDEVFEVRLLQDFKKNWLIVVRPANDEEIKACGLGANEDEANNQRKVIRKRKRV